MKDKNTLDYATALSKASNEYHALLAESGNLIGLKARLKEKVIRERYGPGWATIEHIGKIGEVTAVSGSPRCAMTITIRFYGAVACICYLDEVEFLELNKEASPGDGGAARAQCREFAECLLELKEKLDSLVFDTGERVKKLNQAFTDLIGDMDDLYTRMNK